MLSDLRFIVRKKLLAAAGFLAISCYAMAGANAATKLVVYSTTEADNLKAFAKAFNEDHPNIEINWVRDSTGIITARILAEKDRPVADAVWLLAATSLLLADDEGILHPYTPKGIEKLNPKFIDPDDPKSWTGVYAWVGSVCFNHVEAAKYNLPAPKTWQDLANPVYKGHIVMPNPASSGTGYLDVSSWIQIWGKEKAWEYMDKLHKNISVYTHSGSKPCRMAASGEAVIGVSFPFRGAKLKQKGAPIDIIVPDEGIGWEMQAVGIVKGTKHLDAAKTLMDWAISPKAVALYAERFAVVSIPGMEKPIKHFPSNISNKLIKNDFTWASLNRKQILDKWRNRYDSKTQPKK